MSKKVLSIFGSFMIFAAQSAFAQSGEDGGTRLPDANYELYKTNTVPVLETNCKVSFPWEQPDAASWIGKCENGKLVGEGRLEWRENGKIIWISHVGEEWGLVLKDGNLRISYPVSDFRLSVAKCGNADYKRDISIIAEKDVDPRLFSNSYLTAYIMSSAIRNMAERCKFKNKVTYSGIRASIFVGQPRDERYGWIVEWRADRYGGGNPAGGKNIAAKWQQNNANQIISKEVEAANRAESTEKLAEKRRQSEIRAAKKAELKRQENERRERAAREVAERRNAEITALKKRIDSKWADHMKDQFSGRSVIENVGNLLAFNKAGAIALLSKGVDLRLRTHNLAFQDGKVIISDTHKPTDIYRPVREAEQAGMGELERFGIKTQQIGVNFAGPSTVTTCSLSARSLDKIEGRSVVVFEATLKSLESGHAFFDCKAK